MPLTVCCLRVAVALGVGTGAVFRLVPLWFLNEVGAVTGVVGAACLVVLMSFARPGAKRAPRAGLGPAVIDG